MRVRLIDNGEAARRTAIEAAIHTQAQALETTIVPMTDDGSSLEPGDFVVYLGPSRVPTMTAGQRATLERLAGQDGRVLPVLANPDDARHLPPVLAPVNALIEARYGTEWPHGVVDEILARTFLRRATRRVFISYRRIDSLGIARQLRHALVELGFDVFLDEVSIPPTVDFQRSLKAWLVDSDLMIVLASPRFLDSQWTNEEVAFAGSASLGILSIAWPAAIYGSAATVGFAAATGWSRPMVDGTEGRGTAGLSDEHIELSLADLVDSKALAVEEALKVAPHHVELSAAALERIAGAALRSRARAMRLRLQELLGSARVALETKLGKPVTDAAEPGDLVVEGAAGEMLVRVVPFRPSPSTLQQVWHDARPGGYAAAAVYYGEVDVAAPEVDALRWLAEGTHAEPPSRTVVYMEVGGRVQP